MRRATRKAAALSFLLWAGGVLALPVQAPRSVGPAPDALQLAARIDSRYNALHSLSVEFIQTYDGMGMHRVESGTLLLSKAGALHPHLGPQAGKMRWTYVEPAGKLFVLDGHNAFFYTPGQDEVQRVPASRLESEGGDLRSPLALLLGHADLARQLAGLTLTPAADGDSTLSGVPRGMEQRVSRLSVTAGADGVIHELVVEEVDGARNSFRFHGEQPDAPVSARDFVFQAPPGTHVVDGMPPI